MGAIFGVGSSGFDAAADNGCNQLDELCHLRLSVVLLALFDFSHQLQRLYPQLLFCHPVLM